MMSKKVKIAKKNNKYLKSYSGEFISEYDKFIGQFEKFSESYFSRKEKQVLIYPNLVSRFYAELADFGHGGKALRPFLVYSGYQIAGGSDIRKILPVCLAVELIHNF